MEKEEKKVLQFPKRSRATRRVDTNNADYTVRIKELERQVELQRETILDLVEDYKMLRTNFNSLIAHLMSLSKD